MPVHIENLSECLPNCTCIPWTNMNPFNVDTIELSVLSLNVRSLGGKFPELLAHIELLKTSPSFIIITETWLTAGTDVLLDIPGYRSFSL